jgi:hypothetical protein
LEIDLALQSIPLVFIIISLIYAIFQFGAILLVFLGLAVIGILQLISVFCFILWLRDMVRVKYLFACLVYGVLLIMAKFLLKSDVSAIMITFLSLPMAIFYYWHSWEFYQLNSLLKETNVPPSPPPTHPQSIQNPHRHKKGSAGE